jgi:hypothetical protein
LKNNYIQKKTKKKNERGNMNLQMLHQLYKRHFVIIYSLQYVCTVLQCTTRTQGGKKERKKANLTPLTKKSLNLFRQNERKNCKHQPAVGNKKKTKQENVTFLHVSVSKEGR